MYFALIAYLNLAVVPRYAKFTNIRVWSTIHVCSILSKFPHWVKDLALFDLEDGFHAKMSLRG